ncbi:MAG TPA: sigma-54-dependent Fis family transcriptional regulator [Deltaproteobacteria bacterium]|nr:sigma-54-dependent Fis family transcriptional regulator [Deltaproteobacteria bacterium]
MLIVEPAEFTRHRLRAALRAPDREIHVAATASEGLSALATLQPRLIVLSLELPDLSGLEVVERFVRRVDGAAIVVVGPPSVPEVVASIRRGASDYLNIQDVDAIPDAVARVLEEPVPPRPRPEHRGGRDRYGFRQLLTQSRRMIEVFDQIRQVAHTDATVLISGEAGTGRGLVGRAIHEKSHRAERPFVPIHCDAVSEARLELELFGREGEGDDGPRPSAFEVASGGTLFLDELSATSPHVQVELLRVLEEGHLRRVGGHRLRPVDVRLVASTDEDLEAAVVAGRFRADLFYQLNIFPVRIPPLRERSKDIPLLIRHFLDELSQVHGLEPPILTSAAMKAALAHPWPGNVRQLRSVCEGWVLSRAGQRIGAELVPAERHEPATAGVSWSIDPTTTLKDNATRVTEAIERTYLVQVLERCGGHLGNTAAAAGITRRTLYTKMRHHGLEQGDYRTVPRR